MLARPIPCVPPPADSYLAKLEQLIQAAPPSSIAAVWPDFQEFGMKAPLFLCSRPANAKVGHGRQAYAPQGSAGEQQGHQLR